MRIKSTEQNEKNTLQVKKKYLKIKAELSDMLSDFNLHIKSKT